MKEDYLWNKIGSDAGIEKLEKALEGFRYQSSEPPELPAKVLSLPEKKSFRFLKLGFAVVFVPSFVFILLGLLWIYISPNKNTDRDGDLAATSEPQKNTFVGQPDLQGISPNPEPAQVRMPRKAVAPVKPIKAVVRRIETRDQPEKLTQEEKYAYSQLMLALSITSKELSIVRDKINGREERTAADDREK